MGTNVSEFTSVYKGNAHPHGTFFIEKDFPYTFRRTVDQLNLLPYSWVDVRIKTVLHEPPDDTWFTYTCILKENEMGKKKFTCLQTPKTTLCRTFGILENSF